jgi:hypothetical protein
MPRILQDCDTRVTNTLPLPRPANRIGAVAPRAETEYTGGLIPEVDSIIRALNTAWSTRAWGWIEVAAFESR